jgi:hypothetical protein
LCCLRTFVDGSTRSNIVQREEATLVCRYQFLRARSCCVWKRGRRRAGAGRLRTGGVGLRETRDLVLAPCLRHHRICPRMLAVAAEEHLLVESHVGADCVRGLTGWARWRLFVHQVAIVRVVLFRHQLPQRPIAGSAARPQTASPSRCLRAPFASASIGIAPGDCANKCSQRSHWNHSTEVCASIDFCTTM